MEHWSATSHYGGSHAPETESEIETDLDVDRGFLTDLRDVRVLLDKEKEHKHLVCSQLKVIYSARVLLLYTISPSLFFRVD